MLHNEFCSNYSNSTSPKTTKKLRNGQISELNKPLVETVITEKETVETEK